mgnify:FL=1
MKEQGDFKAGYQRGYEEGYSKGYSAGYRKARDKEDSGRKDYAEREARYGYPQYRW